MNKVPTDPLISIIVPIYKVEKYLPACLDSIITQSYKNIEIILVDDGSPDRSGEICDEYALKDARIIVIHQPNSGLSAARNAGILASKGQIIGFIDSDDLVSSNFIETLYNLMEKYNADISGCDYIEFHDDILPDTFRAGKAVLKVMNNRQAADSLFSDDYVTMTVVYNKLYKRSLFSNVLFPEGKIHEDEFTSYKLLYFSAKTVITDLPMYFYRRRNDSITGAGFNQSSLHALEAFKERMTFFKDQKEKDLYEKAAVRYAHLLIEYYEKAQSLDNARKYEKLIRKRYSRLMPRIIFSNVSYKEKIVLLIYLIHRSLYFKYKDYARKKHGVL
ncbi:MAG: glycosyltransferase family 2 protein [Bacillota bacterium]|nr:glycosyltransferase family 2 protein [Bacillota bacterium]